MNKKHNYLINALNYKLFIQNNQALVDALTNIFEFIA